MKMGNSKLRRGSRSWGAERGLQQRAQVQDGTGGNPAAVYVDVSYRV